MTTRPDRNPIVPLINPSAASPRELAENFRRVYAGALADQRSIRAAGGVYAVRAAAPLEITDEGLALNWQDPRVYEVVSSLVLNHADSGKVKVDDGDAPDFLENQLVDYAGATEDWIGVDIVKPAAHEALQARVAKADVQAMIPPAGPAGTTSEFAIHWQPTAQGTRVIPVFEGDARGRLIRYWMSAGVNSIADCVGGVDGTRQGTQIAEGATLNPYLSCSDSICQLSIDGTSMNLIITLTKSNAGADSVYFYVRVDDFGVIPSDDYQSYAQQ